MKRSAFTLVEVLVVLALAALLAFVAVPTVSKALDGGRRAMAITQMRRIGGGIFQYVEDNNGRLPGPMKVGQGPEYDPGKTDQLASVLGPYLGVTAPAKKTTLSVFLPPAFANAMGRRNLKSTHPYLLNATATFNGETLHPWGTSGDDPTPPMLHRLVPPSLWVICDADQLNPGVKGQPWENKTPAFIVHPPVRLALYFDCRVAAIENSEISRPDAGPPPPPPPKPAAQP